MDDLLFSKSISVNKYALVKVKESHRQFFYDNIHRSLVHGLADFIQRKRTVVHNMPHAEIHELRVYVMSEYELESEVQRRLSEHLKRLRAHPMELMLMEPL